jgi:hypothetical protein
MNPKLQSQIAKSREQALAAFVSKKAEIDDALGRLQALSDDHFNYSPDEITWCHVGTLQHYTELLKRITDMAFNETSTPRKRPDLPPTPRAATRTREVGPNRTGAKGSSTFYRITGSPPAAD